MWQIINRQYKNKENNWDIDFFIFTKIVMNR